MRALALTLLAACGVEEDPCAGRRDLLQSEAGLGLTATEHPMGWGRSECFQCHPAWTLHLEDCLEDVRVDVEALDVRGAGDCVVCHGDNGVQAWRVAE